MYKKTVVGLAVAVLLLNGVTAAALQPKSDYQYDENKHSVPGPVTYRATEIIYGTELQIGSFNAPSDLFVDESGNIYVADSGNNRIAVFNRNKVAVRVIESVNSPDGINTLSDPQGVFVKNGIVYICDTGNSRVIAVDSQNNVIRLIEGNGLISVNENFVFKPEKLVVDTNDNILVTSTAIYQGILRFDSNDEFKNFFAPNQVASTFETFVNSLLKRWFTDSQKENLKKNLPTPYSNIYISNDNFVYTTSEDAASGQDIKCLNPSGTDILVYSSASTSGDTYGDYESSYQKTAFIDIHSDVDGYMLVADKNTQKLFLYDSECNLLSVFGGSGNERGQFADISAVEKLGDDYLILDEEKNSITVMSPTEYMKNVIVAMGYYKNGEYDRSEQIWNDLLSENSNFPFAYRSLGRAQYNLGNYKQAMQYLEMGGDTYFYSLALNGYRKEIVQQNFVILIVGAIVLIVGFVKLAGFLKKKLSS